MAKSPSLRSVLGLLGSLSLLSVASSGSIHEVLRDHGLPAGLLPRTVESFALDRDSGLLSVRLNQSCYAKYESIETLVYFDQEVSGNLSFGGLKAVKGLSQEELFLWLPVREILVADPTAGVILFDIGVAHKQLSLSIFENPPDCRPKEDGDSETLAGFNGGKEAGLQVQR